MFFWGGWWGVGFRFSGCFLVHLGVSGNWGTLFGSPYKKDPNISGTILGSPNLRKPTFVDF